MSDIMWSLTFPAWIAFLSIFSRSIHIVANGNNCLYAPIFLTQSPIGGHLKASSVPFVKGELYSAQILDTKSKQANVQTSKATWSMFIHRRNLRRVPRGWAAFWDICRTDCPLHSWCSHWFQVTIALGDWVCGPLTTWWDQGARCFWVTPLKKTHAHLNMFKFNFPDIHRIYKRYCFQALFKILLCTFDLREVSLITVSRPRIHF